MINLCLCFGDMKVFGDSEPLDFIKELIESHTAIESPKILIGDIDISAIRKLEQEYYKEINSRHMNTCSGFVDWLCRKQASNPDESLLIKPIEA